MSVEAELAADKLIGQVLANRYLIEQRLGEGAMGAVYRARHVKVGRPFAVKVLHQRLLLDNKVLLRFEREAELAGRLRHPNVIGVVDVGEAEGMRYMVMDFAEGPDLASLLSEAPMPARRISQLTRQMLEGLFHAHEQGLIHRDFKPENVIIERDSHGEEVPRIVDFGIAILREGADSTTGLGRLTTNGLVLGTPHYMAPEQAVADPIDHRIDLFALGIIVYEMLCGKLPFDGTGAEVARANLLLDPPRISERVPYLAVDPLLEAFARRLMAKKRELRPPTAKAARELLDLIDRDREAAAAALGVPLASARPAMSTEPLSPRVIRDDYPGTFPPPIRDTTPPEPPPLHTPVAIANGRPPVTTQVAAQLPFDGRRGSIEVPARRSHKPMIAAALAGVGVLGIAIALLVGRSNDKAGDTVAAATPGSNAPTVTPIATPTIAPTDPKPADVKPAEPEPKAVVDIAKPADRTAPPFGGAAGRAQVPAANAVKPVRSTPGHAQKPVKIASPTRPVDGAAPPFGGTSGRALVPAGDTATAAVEPKPIDAQALSVQYRSVGSALKALEDLKGADATSDLWERYRLIRIADAMSSQPKRDDAAAVLAKLQHEIAARKR